MSQAGGISPRSVADITYSIYILIYSTETPFTLSASSKRIIKVQDGEKKIKALPRGKRSKSKQPSKIGPFSSSVPAPLGRYTALPRSFSLLQTKMAIEKLMARFYILAK